MTEKGGEFFKPAGLERSFTVGKVEKPVEEKIDVASTKIKETGVLRQDRFTTDEDRKLAADEVIRVIDPSFSSYDQVVNVSRGEKYTEEEKKKAKEVFDILKKSISLAMNSDDQEMQTKLFTGGVEGNLPKSWLYGRDNSKFNLVNGVREVTITSAVIRENLRKLEEGKAYRRADVKSEKDRELKAGLIEETTLKLIELDVSDEEEDELKMVRAYLNTEAAILRGKFSSKDGSADRADKVAVLGEKLEKVVEKMAEMVKKPLEDMSGITEDLKRILAMKRRIGRGVDELNEDYYPEGIDPITGETREGKYYSRMDITAEMLAISMQLMDPNGARFDSYRPTEWYKKLPKEVRDVIDVMMEVSMAASATYYYGKDLDKLLVGKTNFSFTSEKMRTLFDNNFKLVMSKMLNDLCETYTDQNLHESLRYKEGFYKVPVKSKDKSSEDGDLVWSEMDDNWVLKDGLVIDDDGFLLDSDGKRIKLDESDENIEGRKGKRGIDSEVIKKLRFIENYKGDMAYFLAEKIDGFMKYYKDDDDGHKAGEFILDDKGEKIPNPICKMYANTAWNLWYGMGDSSLADRMRVLPTWNKIVSDPIRTMNPEYKFYSKLQIFKGGEAKRPADLEEAEYFTGELSDYVLAVMDMERKLGVVEKKKRGEKISGDEERPLKWKWWRRKKEDTLRQKILSRKVQILPDKTLYGFFDFVNGGRDLVQVGNERKFYGKYAGDNTKKSLGQFLMDYAYEDEERVETDGTRTKTGRRVLIDNLSERKDFNFKKDQVSFMNEFADSWQAAILFNGYLTGKADAKDPMSWARAIKSAEGMVNGIKFHGDGYFKYVKSPEMWRAMIIGCFKPDMSRLSSEYIPVMRPEEKKKDSGLETPYSFVVYDLLVNKFGLTSDKVDLVRLMQLLGVNIKRGQLPSGDIVRRHTDRWERRDRRVTRRDVRKTRYYGVSKESNNGMSKKNLQKEFDSLDNRYGSNSDFVTLKTSFVRAIDSDKLNEAESILKVIRTKTF